MIGLTKALAKETAFILERAGVGRSSVSASR